MGLFLNITNVNSFIWLIADRLSSLFLIICYGHYKFLIDKRVPTKIKKKYQYYINFTKACYTYDIHLKFDTGYFMRELYY